jgi:hypothetical protein
MKFVIIFLILSTGCVHLKEGEAIEGVDFPHLPPHVIEINDVPHPFNLNNTNQYVIWINGKKVKVKNKDKQAIVALVGASNIKPVTDEDIHNGNGWLRPLYPDRRAFELALSSKTEETEELIFRNENRTN